MKTCRVIALLAFSLAGGLDAQIVSTTERAKYSYQQRIAAAEKARTDGITTLNQAYDNEVTRSKEEFKRSVEPLIRTAAMRNQTEEVRLLTLQMESIINPDGVSVENAGQSGRAGADYNALTGSWRYIGIFRSNQIHV